MKQFFKSLKAVLRPVLFSVSSPLFFRHLRQKCLYLIGFFISFPVLASHSSPLSGFSSHLASCSAHHQAICRSTSGRLCSQFEAGYQASWFSGCLTQGFLHICTHFPLFPNLVPPQGCVSEHSTCMCYFDYGNGTYGYEPGLIEYSALASSPFPVPPVIPPVVPPYFPPPVAQPSLCPFNYSSTCWTYSGRACPQFELGYQSYWFSACLGDGFFHLCVERPSLPKPVLRETCLLRGLACVCDFGWYNGYYNYEPGIIQ